MLVKGSPDKKKKCCDRLYTSRTESGRDLMSVRDCIELERSNLSLRVANSDKDILKVVSEELQLKARLEKKIIKSTKKRKTRQLEGESFTREIPDRN